MLFDFEVRIWHDYDFSQSLTAWKRVCLKRAVEGKV